MTKQFTLMQLFSIVDSRLSNTGMESVYEVLGHVSGDEHITSIGLTIFQDHLIANKPEWWYEVEKDIEYAKKAIGSNEFEPLMKYIEVRFKDEKYDIPQLKDQLV